MEQRRDLLATYVEVSADIGDDPVRQAYLSAAYRRQARSSGPFWETEGGVIILGMFALCVVLPLWLLWKVWELTDPRWPTS